MAVRSKEVPAFAGGLSPALTITAPSRRGFVTTLADVGWDGGNMTARHWGLDYL